MFFKRNTKQLGDNYEAFAQAKLEEAGLKLLFKNYKKKVGEIDLIMQDDNSLVFGEVRYRKNADFGGAAASVTASKQNKIRQTANYYLLETQLESPVRFDVVAITGTQFEWIKGAF